MNRKTVILTCVIIGGIIGACTGWKMTEPSKEITPEYEAMISSAMNKSAQSDIFVDGVASSSVTAEPGTDETIVEYSDLDDLCPSHYGTVVIVPTLDKERRKVYMMVGPEETVKQMRARINYYTQVHFCEPEY